jgi:hypothetical protein
MRHREPENIPRFFGGNMLTTEIVERREYMYSMIQEKVVPGAKKPVISHMTYLPVLVIATRYLREERRG